MEMIEIKIVVEIVQGLLTSIGIVGAAVWSIFVFGLGRNFAANIVIGVKLKSRVEVNGMKAAILSIQAKNMGKTQVKKESFSIICTSSDDWMQDKSSRPFRRIDLTRNEIAGLLPMKSEICVDYRQLEPGEETVDEIAVNLRTSTIIQVSACFVGKSSWWRSDQQWVANVIIDTQQTSTEAENEH
jgi:hypothetical protein